MENKEYNLVVVGGGAAGLMAAGVAAGRGQSVILLEKMEKTGRKVRISGKGRCNLTNTRSEEEFLEKVQCNAEFFRPAFKAFPNTALMNFFERLGVKVEVEHGCRVFPKSGKAWDIAQALVDWCRELGVTIECEAKVENILTINNKVLGVEYRNSRGFIRRIEAPNVILSTGGATYPATGSTGDGYKLAHRLGHNIIAIRPSLVPLESDYHELPYMAGLLLKNINLSLLIDGEKAVEEFGEMAFTKRAIEGAVILRVSRLAVDALIDGHNVDISIDLKPALVVEDVEKRILREINEQPATLTVGELVRKIVPRELVLPMAKCLGLNVRRPMSDLTDEAVKRFAALLKDFRLHITDYRPFEEAIVTAGGVDVNEVWPETMESKLVKGLYFAGELLDIDANTGGYNLQMAFSTGHLAAQLRKQR